MVRHDGDDPYLVVAADKGTATFSDYANAIATEYGFWLGDAFASGGSAGYDHKKMGITARGAWESVKRHFREIGVDTQTQDFTVAGIGDMSGDVFGNGMLLSRHIRLVAAFDHRHIFLDPAAGRRRELRRARAPVQSAALVLGRLRPEAHLARAAASFRAAPSRSPLSPEVQKVLGIEAEHADAERAHQRDPQGAGRPALQRRHRHLREVEPPDARRGRRPRERRHPRERRATCAARWWPKAATSASRSSGASSTRCKGGRINTDAIDNSAGVDCSDHEVNIKILLGLPMPTASSPSKQRNQLLADMTDEVAALVLRDNYFQTQSLSVSGVLAASLLDAQERFIRYLEKAGRLNRALEFLPNDEEFAERRAAKLGLTAPERAVLLAYSKIALNDGARRVRRARRSVHLHRARALLPGAAARALPARDPRATRCAARSSPRTSPTA